jgi:two-component system, NarL family, nitrate/nitrite response regulator NarL
MNRLVPRSGTDRRQISVVIADDHPIVLAGLQTLLQREPDISVIDGCADGIETLRAVAKHKPDVLILDLRMPRADGVAVLQQMKKAGSATRVVVLAAVVGEEELLEAIRLGAGGVVLKEMAAQFLVDCVREVHAGRQWFEQRAIGDAMEKFVRRDTASREMTSVLSRREIDVVRAVAQGLRNREIGERLGIAEGTVKLHLHTIYTKLGVDGRTALVVKLGEKAFL